MTVRPARKAEVLATHTTALFAAALARAVTLLQAGEVVALPTETVYGLAANALDARAVRRIFEAKGRPAHNPIIVHVASLNLAQRCVRHWPEQAARLAAAFWPGPLTLVLPRADIIPDIVAAGGSTVGVRWPNHPFTRAVIRDCGFPLAAPSANRSFEVSPTTAEHVLQTLGDRIPLVIDGGPTSVGIESTVLDLSLPTPQLLRPGMVSLAAIRTICGDCAGPELDSAPNVANLPRQSQNQQALRSPGLLSRHYAPRANLIVCSWPDSPALKSQITNLRFEVQEVHVLAHTVLPSIPGLGRVCVMPRDPALYARGLYAELHRCDEMGARLILVETPPPTADWLAIADRLRRAAHSQEPPKNP